MNAASDAYTNCLAAELALRALMARIKVQWS